MGTTEMVNMPGDHPGSSTSCSLNMECEEEPLTRAQLSFADQRKIQFQSQMLELEKLSSKASKFLIDSNTAVISVPEPTTVVNKLMPQMIPVQSPSGNRKNQPRYRLIMDPNSGRVIGTVDSTGGTDHVFKPVPSSPSISTKKVHAVSPSISLPLNQLPLQPQIPLPTSQIPPPTPINTSPIPISPPLPTYRPPMKQILQFRQPPPPLLPLKQQPIPLSTVSQHTKTTFPPVSNTLATTVKQDQISDKSNSDKIPAYNIPPTLSVLPKSMKNLPPSQAAAIRKQLDTKVKGLLVRNPAKFTEFLIRQGLIPKTRYKVNPETGKKVELKLGMYSGENKFPRSGGYVWINEREPTVFYSVFDASIFQASEMPPITVLKLIYHWSCQTNIQNIVQWVKVDIKKVDLYFKILRSICTISIDDSFQKMGGLKKKIQIGVISLGTTSSDGSRKEVKVEVLGILEVETCKIRLRATQPTVGVTQAERFARIFKCLPGWVVDSSIIVTDFSVDREQLTMLGFKDVLQSSATSKKSTLGNGVIMDYLKRIVPKMFQTNLSRLSAQQVQQFLDELTFRELGYHPLSCFDNILKEIAHITRVAKEDGMDLLDLLNKVEKNPFKSWKHKGEENVTQHDSKDQKTDSSVPKNVGMKRSSNSDSDSDLKVTKKAKLSTNIELVDLQTYFYGTLQGDEEILRNEFKADMAFKCHFCRKVYFNNLDFMAHLCLHIGYDKKSNVDFSDLNHCKYCCKNFETTTALERHIYVSHMRKNCECMCQICVEGFKSENYLALHMLKTHIRSELPYMCNVCGFRSSFHKNLVDHFHQEHDRTDKLQCPICLKLYSLMGEKGYNSTIASAFANHIQSHLTGKTFSCKRCNLNFLQDAYLRNHIMRDHASFKEFENLSAYVYQEDEKPIRMTKPEDRIARNAIRKTGVLKLQPQSAFAAQNLEDMLMYNIYKEDCCECNKKMTNPGHYAAYLCCTKCRYSTCCSRAISIHYSLFHGHFKGMYTLGTPCILNDNIFCVCGFKTNSGNKMAKHLSANFCKTAYPSKKAAKTAIRGPNEEKSNLNKRIHPNKSSRMEEGILLSETQTKEHKSPSMDISENHKIESVSSIDKNPSNGNESDGNSGKHFHPVIENIQSQLPEEDLESAVEKFPFSVDQQDFDSNDPSCFPEFSYVDDEFINGEVLEYDVFKNDVKKERTIGAEGKKESSTAISADTPCPIVGCTFCSSWIYDLHQHLMDEHGCSVDEAHEFAPVESNVSKSSYLTAEMTQIRKKIVKKDPLKSFKASSFQANEQRSLAARSNIAEEALTFMNIVIERFYQFLIEEVNKDTASSYKNAVRQVFSWIISRNPSFNLNEIFSNNFESPQVLFPTQYYRLYLEENTCSPKTSSKPIKAMNKFSAFMDFYLTSEGANMPDLWYQNIKQNIVDILEVGTASRKRIREQGDRASLPIDSSYHFLRRPRILLQYLKKLILSEMLRKEIEDLTENMSKYVSVGGNLSAKSVRDICLGLLFLDNYAQFSGLLLTFTYKEWLEARTVQDHLIISCASGDPISKKPIRIVIDDPLYIDLLKAYDEFARGRITCIQNQNFPFFTSSRGDGVLTSMRGPLEWIRKSLTKFGISDPHDPEFLSITIVSVKGAFGMLNLDSAKTCDDEVMTGGHFLVPDPGNDDEFKCIEIKQKCRNIFNNF
ncbi:uncharacterized protein [Lepeophtheirus salmonis]|uniref:uncharacterized protein isoform X1 n=1 Tax=Lepeophtheirus salmonis TaxID=72036 RepID=UPI001AE8A3FE|nr:uncharacterized protein LOC121120322 isoform X1 [Lepeophtheirus salmonis]